MLRCYQDGDLERIKLQPEQELERSSEWEKLKNDKTLVFCDKDKVLALVYPMEDEGKITLFALVSRDSGYKAVHIVKTMRSWIIEQFTRNEIYRIDMTTQANFDQANRLAELLGFTYEGTLHSYFRGIDFNIWGIWK